jgi:hypothetical protein
MPPRIRRYLVGREDLKQRPTDEQSLQQTNGLLAPHDEPAL